VPPVVVTPTKSVPIAPLALLTVTTQVPAALLIIEKVVPAAGPLCGETVTTTFFPAVHWLVAIVKVPPAVGS
jgi:hypothetical protein